MLPQGGTPRVPLLYPGGANRGGQGDIRADSLGNTLENTSGGGNLGYPRVTLHGSIFSEFIQRRRALQGKILRGTTLVSPEAADLSKASCPSTLLSAEHMAMWRLPCVWRLGYHWFLLPPWGPTRGPQGTPQGAPWRPPKESPR